LNRTSAAAPSLRRRPHEDLVVRLDQHVGHGDAEPAVVAQDVRQESAVAAEGRVRLAGAVEAHEAELVVVERGDRGNARDDGVAVAVVHARGEK
jgi:hypothetical protein